MVMQVSTKNKNKYLSLGNNNIPMAQLQTRRETD